MVTTSVGSAVRSLPGRRLGLIPLLEYLAVERGFVTAYFSQDIQSRLAFNRPDLVYRRIIETMRLPQDPDRIADPFAKNSGRLGRQMPAKARGDQ